MSWRTQTSLGPDTFKHTTPRACWSYARNTNVKTFSFCPEDALIYVHFDKQTLVPT